MTKLEKLENLFAENRIYGMVFQSPIDSVVGVEISWGDWKHDHARADYLVTKNLGWIKVSTQVTEENGSDCYSAIHYYFTEV